MSRVTAGKSGIKFSGSGPGEQTLDGCSVEFYRRLPATKEPDVVASQVNPPASLLELGCGVGRLTHPLVDLGYEVTAVDNSQAMLDHVQNAHVVLSDIESLNLEERFDVVLLASRILNAPSATIRESLFQSVQRHLKPSGVFLAEVHAANVLTQKTGDASQGPHYSARILSAATEGQRANITIEYTMGNDTWSQCYETEYLPETQIEQELERSGLRFDGWVDETKTWFRAFAL